MQHGQYSSMLAIASRDLTKTQEAVTALCIATAYGSYEELLAVGLIERDPQMRTTVSAR
jgi:predicted dehydrogenase